MRTDPTSRTVRADAQDSLRKSLLSRAPKLLSDGKPFVLSLSKGEIWQPSLLFGALELFLRQEKSKLRRIRPTLAGRGYEHVLQ